MAAQKESKIWEYETLMEFLNEDLTKDDLMFYLHIRNLLFKG